MRNIKIFVVSQGTLIWNKNFINNTNKNIWSLQNFFGWIIEGIYCPEECRFEYCITVVLVETIFIDKPVLKS